MACWAMDFPFMRRYTKAQLEARPELKGQDVEATRRACEVYKHEPVTDINFLDGTRFREAKRLTNKSPYHRLLRTKAGGLSSTLNSIGTPLAGVTDVTIAHRPPNKTLT